MKIYAVLFLFFGLYLSVCIWIFLIITDSVRKITLHGFFRTKQDFVEVVERHFKTLSENQSVPEEEIVLLCKKLHNNKMKRYFLQRFIFYADRIQNKNSIKEYFQTAFPYCKDMLPFAKNVHYSEKSYRLMLLGEFRQDSEEINRFILDTLEDESFDVRTNALRALSIIGNSGSFNQGLIKVCSSEKYFNIRHIAEMIGSFEGDPEELRQQMLDSFYENQDTYRCQVIMFLADRASNASMDFVLTYLQSSPENKENLIACLRYFSACEVSEQAKEAIFKLLHDTDFEIRAVAVKLTPKYFYSDRDIIDLLLGEKFLKSKDWYVRRNSAAALVRFGFEKEEIKNHLPKDDQYAREALIYAMFDAGIATYEEFVELGGGLNGIA